MGINAVSADHLLRSSGAFRAPPVFPGLRRFDIIQMMHGSEWTLKYDEPEVENAHEGAVRDGIPARRRSPIQVLTGPDVR